MDRSFLLKGILVSLTYLLLGALGSFFTIAPGFASAIWPAAGVALAIYIKYGTKSLPWIFIGSVAANITTFDVPISSLTLAEWFWNATRSGGSILQVVFARYLLFKFNAVPIALISFTQILKVLIFCGPIACTVAASVGAITLFHQGFIDAEISSFVWFSWWVGDSIGVMFFLPLSLIILRSKYIKKVGNKKQVIVIALALFTIVSFTFNYSKELYKSKQVDNFERLAKEQVHNIEVVKNGIENQLVALSALFRANPTFSREEFAQYAQDTNKAPNKFRAVGWIDKILPSHIEQWQQRIISDGLTAMSLKMITADGFKPVVKQKYYLPITYLEPLTQNIAAVGLDLFSHPVASIAIFKSIKMGAAQATQPLQLAQQSDKITGNVIYYPVYSLSKEPYDISGLVEVVIELDNMIKKLLVEHKNSHLFHFSMVDVEHSPQAFITSGTLKNSLFSNQYSIDWFGRNWQLTLASSRDFEHLSKDWLSWVTLVVGLIIATFGVAFIIVLTSFNNQLRLQVDKQTKQLKDMVVDLEKASKAKSTFLANMSHELRTPLNAIIGFIDIAQNKIQDVTAIGYFRKIQHSSELLLNVINQVLDISKIESGKLVIDFHTFDLQQTANRLSSVFAETAKQKGLSFEMDLFPLKLPWVIQDQMRIEQIATNLIGNAIKFTEKGCVCLRITLTKEPQPLLTISIKDTGIGISAAQQISLFEQFEQADSSTTRKYGGTGLGLTITQQLCHLMKGEITLISELGGGSCFTVSLPIEVAEVQDLPASNLLDEKTFLEKLVQLNLKILLVEDNRINQVVACEMLKQFQATITLAVNGQEAIDKLQTMTELPNLILMDIQMPIMDGYQATAIIKQDKKLASIPIIALSANATVDDILQAKQYGMLDYLTKPIQQEQLFAAIVKHVEIASNATEL